MILADELQCYITAVKQLNRVNWEFHVAKIEGSHGVLLGPVNQHLQVEHSNTVQISYINRRVQSTDIYR